MRQHVAGLIQHDAALAPVAADHALRASPPSAHRNGDEPQVDRLLGRGVGGRIGMRFLIDEGLARIGPAFQRGDVIEIADQDVFR